jgi:hypothetical protein
MASKLTRQLRLPTQTIRRNAPLPQRQRIDLLGWLPFHLEERLSVSVSCRLSATGVRFLGILARQRLRPSLTVGLPERRIGSLDSGGFSTFHTREIRPDLGALSTPRPAVLSRPASAHRSPLATFLWPGPVPRSRIHFPGVFMTKHQQGFTFIHPPGASPHPQPPDGTGTA